MSDGWLGCGLSAPFVPFVRSARRPFHRLRLVVIGFVRSTPHDASDMGLHRYNPDYLALYLSFDRERNEFTSASVSSVWLQIAPESDSVS
jgi:hypothetical protein